MGKQDYEKCAPIWTSNREVKISTAASMGTGQTWGMVRVKALSQLLNPELKSGHYEKAGLAKEKLQGHIESQLLTMWHGCANNIRQAKLTCKNQRLSDSFWANVSGSLGGRKAGLQVQYALQTEERVPAQRQLPCVQSVENLRHALGSLATFSPLESNQPAEKSPV